MMMKRYIKKLLPVLMALTLNACVGGGTSPVANFYLLEPIAENPDVASQRISIGLYPVRVPNYVDRPQIVTATAKNAYRLNEFQRWAEPLDQNITRVLAANLTQLVPADVLLMNVSSLAKQANLHLAVNILEFHVDPEGQAVLTAQWSISKGNAMLSNQQNSYRFEASSSDYPLMVVGLNKCLNRLNRDIAQTLRQFAIQ